MDQTAYNAAAVRRLYEEGMNGRNPALLDALVAPTYFGGATPNVRAPQSREAWKQRLVNVWRAVPDHRYTVVDVLAEADKVVVRISARYTPPRPPNAPPATQPVEEHEICFFRLSGGQITEWYSLCDALGVAMQQMPNPKPPGSW